MKNIAIVAKTAGLEFDDRIRKECISLSKKNNVFVPPPTINNSPPKKELSDSNFPSVDIQSNIIIEEETSLHKQDSKLIDEETPETNIGEFSSTDVQSLEVSIKSVMAVQPIIPILFLLLPILYMNL